MSNAYDTQQQIYNLLQGQFGATMPTNPSLASTPINSRMNQVFNSYLQYLPYLSQMTASQELPLAMAQYGATAATQPLYNALNLQQLQQYALPEAQVGQDIARSNALSGAQTNLMQLQGAGGDAAAYAQGLTNALNPALAAANSGAARAVNAINLQGLSPGEAAATERALNQANVGTGNLGLMNNTNAIANAMNFGGAFNSKIGLLNNATNAAANAANASTNAINPVNVALGQPNTSTMSNFGAGQFQPTSATTGTGTAGNAFSFGGGLLGNQSSMMNAQTGASSALQQTNSIPSYISAIGGACCFIFLEAYNGELPWWIRKCRDYYYEQEPQVATGYKRMAKWLVPAMKHSRLVRWAVNRFMIQPLTLYGGWLMCVEGYEDCQQFQSYKRFWFNVWRKLGK